MSDKQDFPVGEGEGGGMYFCQFCAMMFVKGAPSW